MHEEEAVAGLTTDVWSVEEDAFPRSGTPAEQARELLRYAILAPSSHNSQPWSFRLDGDVIRVFADTSRWLEVADPDRRELYLSVGCAIENLVTAAQHFGLPVGVDHLSGDGEDAPLVRVRLGDAGGGTEPFRPPRLFDAILRRHTNRGAYDGRPVPEEVQRRLRELAREEDIEVRFTEDPGVRRRVDELTVRADSLLFADPRWREELGRWLGRGVFGTGWLISKMGQLAVTHLDLSGAVGRKDSELLQSAPLFGLVAVDEPWRQARVRAGQVFERLFLAATDEGLALQPMNQILQVPEVREEFLSLLPAGWGHPQITFRLGHAEPEEHTPRWPLETVLGDGR